MAYEVVRKEKDARPRFTYRPTEEKAIRIKALKNRYGISFQQMTDLLYDEWLYKLQHETEMFRDLTIGRQIPYVARDMANFSTFKRFFKKDLTKANF